MKRFDKKFGDEFLKSVPKAPAVYRLYDIDGAVFYVGKAKDLRRRLAQYRNASRARRDRKMRTLIAEAARIEWTVSPSELDAELEEVRLIQTLRPRANVASAFEFLYPFVGLRRRGGDLHFCLTTTPESFDDHAFHGAFRSRETTGGAFFALMRLLRHVGHPIPRRNLRADDSVDYSYVFAFRRLPVDYTESWSAFLRGESDDALRALALCLLEKPKARANAAEVHEDLQTLQRFWVDEACALRAAITATGFPHYPVSRTMRDPLFLRMRAARTDGRFVGEEP